MAFLLYILVVSINLFLVIINKKSKVITAVSIIILALLVGFAPSSDGDLSRYRYAYENAIRDSWEPGYMLFSQLVFSLGFSFDAFRIVTFIIGLTLCYFTVNDYTKNLNAIILFYSLVLMYFLSVTLRFFLGFAITVFALRFLLKRKIVPYILLVILASTFHISFIAALAFIVVLFPEKFSLKFQKILIVTNFIFAGLITVMLVVPTVSGTVSKFLISLVELFPASDFSEAATDYLTVAYARNRLIYAFFYYINLFCLFPSVKFLKAHGGAHTFFLDSVITISLMTGLLLPTLIYAPTMIRLLFCALFLMMTVFSCVFDAMASNKSHISFGLVTIDRYSYVVLILLSFLTWFVRLYIVGELSYSIVSFLTMNTLIW